MQQPVSFFGAAKRGRGTIIVLIRSEIVDRTALELGAEASALQDVLTAGRVDTAFQPVVEPASGHVVGYVALTRGPAGRDINSAVTSVAAPLSPSLPFL